MCAWNVGYASQKFMLKCNYRFTLTWFFSFIYQQVFFSSLNNLDLEDWIDVVFFYIKNIHKCAFSSPRLSPLYCIHTKLTRSQALTHKSWIKYKWDGDIDVFWYSVGVRAPPIMEHVCLLRQHLTLKVKLNVIALNIIIITTLMHLVLLTAAVAISSPHTHTSMCEMLVSLVRAKKCYYRIESERDDDDFQCHFIDDFFSST